MSVYYIHAPETGLVKIGFAKNPELRFVKMQVDSPTRLVLLAVEDGGKSVEQQRHLEFHELRQRGEWFRFEGRVAAHVASLPPYIRREPRRREIAGPFGAWLRENGHTTETFAELVGTTPPTIWRACNGCLPRRDLLLRIVEATDWEIDANVLCGIPPRPSKEERAA